MENQHLSQEQLSQFYENRLSAGEKESAERHLNHCADCEKAYQMLVGDRLRDTESYIVTLRKTGKHLRCIYCDHDRFHTRSALLNTKMMTLFGLDWLNQPANCHICSQCGYIHWFME